MTAEEGVTWLRERIRAYEGKLADLQAEMDALQIQRDRTQNLVSSARILLQAERHGNRIEHGQPDVELAGLSLTEAAIRIVESSPDPIHADLVLRRLMEAGKTPKSKNPKNSVVTVLLRASRNGDIRKVGPNLFASRDG